jgi:hypothetical protein
LTEKDNYHKTSSSTDDKTGYDLRIQKFKRLRPEMKEQLLNIFREIEDEPDWHDNSVLFEMY